MLVGDVVRVGPAVRSGEDQGPVVVDPRGAGSGAGGVLGERERVAVGVAEGGDLVVEGVEEHLRVARLHDEGAAEVLDAGDVGGLDAGLLDRDRAVVGIREPQARVDGGVDGVEGRDLGAGEVLDQRDRYARVVGDREVAPVVPVADGVAVLIGRDALAGDIGPRGACRGAAGRRARAGVEVGGHAAVGRRLVGIDGPVDGDRVAAVGGEAVGRVVRGEHLVDEPVRRNQTAGILEGRLHRDDERARRNSHGRAHGVRLARGDEPQKREDEGAPLRVPPRLFRLHDRSPSPGQSNRSTGCTSVEPCREGSKSNDGVESKIRSPYKGPSPLTFSERRRPFRTPAPPPRK